MCMWSMQLRHTHHAAAGPAIGAHDRLDISSARVHGQAERHTSETRDTGATHSDMEQEAADTASAAIASPSSGETLVCAACFGEIGVDGSDSLVRMDTQLWHMDCFCCIRCHRKVLGDQESVIMVDGMPLCTSCTLLCGGCGQPVSEEAILCDSDAYHPECFCCSLCALPIDTNVYARGHGLLCCVSCNAKMEQEACDWDTNTASHPPQLAPAAELASPRSPPTSEQSSPAIDSLIQGSETSKSSVLSPHPQLAPEASPSSTRSAEANISGASSAASPVVSPAASPAQPASRDHSAQLPAQEGTVPRGPRLPPILAQPRIRHGHSASVGLLDVSTERYRRPRSGSSPPSTEAVSPTTMTQHDQETEAAANEKSPGESKQSITDTASPEHRSEAVTPDAEVNDPVAGHVDAASSVPISKRLSEVLQLDIVNEYGAAEEDALRTQRQSTSSVASQRSDRELVLQIISAHTGFVSPAQPSEESGDESVAVPIENGDMDMSDRPLDLGVLRNIALAELFAIDAAAAQDPDAAVHNRVTAVIEALAAHLDVLKARCAKQLAAVEERHADLEDNITRLEDEKTRLSGENASLENSIRQRAAELAEIEARVSEAMPGIDRAHAMGADAAPAARAPRLAVSPPSGDAPAAAHKRLDASLPPLPSPRKFNWIRPRLISGLELAALRPLIKEALLQTPQDAAAMGSDISPPVPPKPDGERISGHTFQPVTGAVIRGMVRCLVCQRIVRAPPELRCTLCQQSVHGRCVGGAAACAHSGPPLPPVVFGSSLSEQLALENAAVPRVVEACIRAIEEQDMDYEGIYRKSGSLQQQRTIVQLFQSGARFSLADTYFFNDRAAITGTLKQYLRELREPLIPRSLHGRLYALADYLLGTPPPSVLEALRDIIAEVPKSHLPTLVRVLQHLYAISLDETGNKMNSRALGLVFGRAYATNQPRCCVAKDPRKSSSRPEHRPRLSVVRRY